MALKYSQELRQYCGAIAQHGAGSAELVDWVILRTEDSADSEETVTRISKHWGAGRSLARTVLQELDKAAAALPALIEASGKEYNPERMGLGPRVVYAVAADEEDMVLLYDEEAF